ncbi:SDR family NAD(P)-dependent oxidoreductase [Streptosporangium sp. NPDC006013]|uniref:SDR family NAD(P)-dependent oxidoreductase n=1 Tax=Streptosporangium sp. NPDC006013 TaxID=3155596 RepID=UPI0033A6EFD3
MTGVTAVEQVVDGTAEPGPVGVVVTGAARGLGKAVAEAFAGEGAAVVAVDLHESVQDVAGELGEGHRAVVGDVGDPSVLEQAFRLAAEIGGGLATLVLNAGVTSPGETADFPVEEWDRVLSVNLRAAFTGAKAAYPHLGPGSSIVMVSSICASLGFGARAAYCASKSGIDGLVRALAVEWAPAGVRVNAVAPGTIATEMQAAMVASGRISNEGYVARIPMGRVGKPSEIADAVVYLASPRASYITGVVLPVDGGWANAGLPPNA